MAYVSVHYVRPMEQGRPLYFCPVVCSSSSFFLFSSNNLSRLRFDVCHTSTDGVALVRIQDAGLKRAARGSLKIQHAKNRHLHTIAQLCRAITSQRRHVSTFGKIVKSQIPLRQLVRSQLRTCSELVRSQFVAGSKLKFGLSSSLLAENQHELAGSRPNSITLASSELAPNQLV